MPSNEGKKTKPVQLDIDNYKYLCSRSKINHRTISEQVNWICRIVFRLQGHHKGTYSKIIEELEDVDKLKNVNEDR